MQLQVSNAPESLDILSKRRLTAARTLITSRMTPIGPLRLLGMGNEGIVFTDGQSTWKLFDRWSQSDATRAMPILQRLMKTVSCV